MNWGHGDFQSPALPTELSRHKNDWIIVPMDNQVKVKKNEMILLLEIKTICGQFPPDQDQGLGLGPQAPNPLIFDGLVKVLCWFLQG